MASKKSAAVEAFKKVQAQEDEEISGVRMVADLGVEEDVAAAGPIVAKVSSKLVHIFRKDEAGVSSELILHRRELHALSRVVALLTSTDAEKA